MIVILMGVCGCGKTTVGRLLAERTGWPFHEGDEFHPPENVEKMSRSQPLTDEDRQPWLSAIADEIRATIDREKSAVFACSALKGEYRKKLWQDDPHVRFVWLTGSEQILRDRMAAREDHYMPADLLDSQFETLETPDDVPAVDIDTEPEKITDEVQRVLGL